MRIINPPLKPLLILLALLLILLSFNHHGLYSERADVKQFIQTMVIKHSFDRKELISLFNTVKIKPELPGFFSKKLLCWIDYRSCFINPELNQQGVMFWQKNAYALTHATALYGIPAEIIVAIIGIESRYGKNTGRHRVIEALCKYSFNFPRRAKYFQSELENYLLLARELGFDPAKVKGSYDGGIGQPQFMPSNYRRFAIDATGKGYSDLMVDEYDVILSVAHFLKENGWKTGVPTALAIEITPQQIASLSEFKIKPTKTLSQLKRIYGLKIPSYIPSNIAATFIVLPDIDQKKVWLGFHNLYVLSRYNKSMFYITTVYESSQAIKANYYQSMLN